MTIKQDFARKAAERILCESNALGRKLHTGGGAWIGTNRIAQIIRQEAKKAEKGGKK